MVATHTWMRKPCSWQPKESVWVVYVLVKSVATLVNMFPNVAKKTMRLIALCRNAEEHEKVTRTNRHPMSETTEHPRSIETIMSASSSEMPFMVGVLPGGWRVRPFDQAGQTKPGMCGSDKRTVACGCLSSK